VWCRRVCTGQAGDVARSSSTVERRSTTSVGGQCGRRSTISSRRVPGVAAAEDARPHVPAGGEPQASDIAQVRRARPCCDHGCPSRRDSAG
jgi:hypothetical protein